MDDSARPGASVLSRLVEGLAIAIVTTIISVFASVWATNHVGGAKEDREYLLAKDARDHAMQALQAVSQNREARLLIRASSGAIQTFVARGDDHLSQDDYDQARRDYNRALVAARPALGVVVAGCAESPLPEVLVACNLSHMLYETSRGIAQNIR
jgi:hypothetical protein